MNGEIETTDAYVRLPTKALATAVAPASPMPVMIITGWKRRNDIDSITVAGKVENSEGGVGFQPGSDVGGA